MNVRLPLFFNWRQIACKIGESSSFSDRIFLWEHVSPTCPVNIIQILSKQLNIQYVYIMYSALQSNSRKFICKIITDIFSRYTTNTQTHGEQICKLYSFMLFRCQASTLFCLSFTHSLTESRLKPFFYVDTKLNKRALYIYFLDLTKYLS